TFENTHPCPGFGRGEGGAQRRIARSYYQDVARVRGARRHAPDLYAEAYNKGQCLPSWSRQMYTAVHMAVTGPEPSVEGWNRDFRPLEGITVLEIGSAASVAVAGWVLGQLGAEVFVRDKPEVPTTATAV